MKEAIKTLGDVCLQYLTADCAKAGLRNGHYIDMLSSGFTRREVREKRIIRLFKEKYEQGAPLVQMYFDKVQISEIFIYPNLEQEGNERNNKAEHKGGY